MKELSPHYPYIHDPASLVQRCPWRCSGSFWLLLVLGSTLGLADLT